MPFSVFDVADGGKVIFTDWRQTHHYNSLPSRAMEKVMVSR